MNAKTRSLKGATTETGTVAVGLSGRPAVRITYTDGATEVRFRTGYASAWASTMRRATAKQAATFTPAAPAPAARPVAASMTPAQIANLVTAGRTVTLLDGPRITSATTRTNGASYQLRTAGATGARSVRGTARLDIRIG